MKLHLSGQETLQKNKKGILKEERQSILIKLVSMHYLASASGAQLFQLMMKRK